MYQYYNSGCVLLLNYLVFFENNNRQIKFQQTESMIQWFIKKTVNYFIPEFINVLNKSIEFTKRYEVICNVMPEGYYRYLLY